MFGRVPALKTPTFAVTVGQRPFSSWIPLDERGAGDDRAAALLRLDARVRGAAVDRQAEVGDALARRHEVAVRAGALEDEARVGRLGGLDDVRRRGRRADLLVRVGDERRCARTGQAPRQSREARRSPGGPRAARPSCRDTPGARAMPSSIRNGRLATVPSEKTVSMWPISRRRGPAPGAPSNVPTTVSPNRPFGSGRRSTWRAQPLEVRRDPGRDLVDAARRVAAAVDAAQPLEVGEERRQAGLDGRVDLRPARRR